MKSPNVLFEVERENNHLAVGGADGIGIGLQSLVLKVVDMGLRQTVGKTVAELKLRDELEEGKVKVAAYCLYA